MTSYLLWFWSRSNNYSLARDIVEKMLLGEISPLDIRARIYTGYAKILGAFPDQQERSIGMFKDAAELWSDSGNRIEEALTLSDLAIAYFGALQDESGLQIAKQANEKAISTGNEEVILFSKTSLSQGLTNNKSTSAARVIAKENIIAGEKIGNLFVQFGGHVNTADCAMLEEKYLEAEKEYGRCIEITRLYGDFVYTCVSVSGLAMALAGQGRHAKAQSLIAAVNLVSSEAGLISIEDYPVQFWQELFEQHIRIPRKILGDSLIRQYREEGQKMSWDEAVEYALDFKKD
jgi:tetratricopeptide (TPR) repeat protein